MSKIRAGVLAREWLREHAGEDIHGPAFMAWAKERELNTASMREVRIQIIRQRNFNERCG